MSSFKVIDPYTKETYKEFEYATYEQAFKSLDKLKSGLKDRPRTKSDRAQVLNKLGELLLVHKEELALMITCEMGKTISDSYIEIDRSANTVFATADAIKTMTDEVLDSDAYSPNRGKIGIVKRKPIGIILAITPFNFPINLSLHKIAPSFAAGNSTLFKPGPQNYFSGKRLVELCYEAGFSEGEIQLSCPDIPVLSKLVESEDINCISFTGGTTTAKAIAKNAGVKKLLFELGGNDPLIIMPDADLDKATSIAINQRFGTAGQRCTAAKRVFVHKEIYNKFKTLLIPKAESLIIGDPKQKDTFIGPVVNKLSADTVESRIKEAIDQGANILLGNKREGNIIHPTILESVSPESELIREETFGPVMPLIKFDKLDDLITMINSSSYGLQSGVFTNDLSIIKKLYEELEVGALAVNDGPGFRAEHFPFGGVKSSGLGREGVKYTIDEMSVLKTLIM